MFGLQILNEIGSLQREIDQIFRSVGVQTDANLTSRNVGFQVYDNEDHYSVVAALPGLDVESLDISVLGRQLTISGSFAKGDVPEGAIWHRQERRSGNFEQRVGLPTNLDTEKIEADYSNGILKIKLPKAASVLPRKIEVNVA